VKAKKQLRQRKSDLSARRSGLVAMDGGYRPPTTTYTKSMAQEEQERLMRNSARNVSARQRRSAGKARNGGKPVNGGWA
jgi:hypothetical protein